MLVRRLKNHITFKQDDVNVLLGIKTQLECVSHVLTIFNGIHFKNCVISALLIYIMIPILKSVNAVLLDISTIISSINAIIVQHKRDIWLKMVLVQLVNQPDGIQHSNTVQTVSMVKFSMQQTLDVSVLPIFQTIMDQLAYQAVQF